MNVLEKILEEIEEEIRDSIPFSDQSGGVHSREVQDGECCGWTA